MTFQHPDISIPIEIRDDKIASLVIENQRFFRKLIEDLHALSEGGDGKSKLWNGDYAQLPFHKKAEVIMQFVPFTLNRKTLISSIISRLEKEAVSAERWEQTQHLLLEISNYVTELAFDLPCDIVCEKNYAQNLLKSIGISVFEDDSETLEKIFDYMQLLRELDFDKLFIFVNMHDYFTEEEMERFFETVIGHSFKILLIDSHCHNLSNYESRLIIDKDLCEI